jgi:hypothetical protein
MIKELWSAIETEMKALGFIYGTEEKDRRFAIGIGPVVSDQEERGTIGGERYEEYGPSPFLFSI